VGATKPVDIDIRVVGATNMRREHLTDENRFRQDLLFRLNTVEIDMPPLRERSGDLPLLVDHFLKKHSLINNRQERSISKRALELLSAYAWPGNVRELEHIIERILILEDCKVIEPEHLPAFITQRQGEFQVFSDEDFSLEDLESRYIQFVLRRTKGKRQEAARILGINRKTLGSKIKKYELRVNW
jgi:DNA-binding NtrC family response regulator